MNKWLALFISLGNICQFIEIKWLYCCPYEKKNIKKSGNRFNLNNLNFILFPDMLFFWSLWPCNRGQAGINTQRWIYYES